MMPEETVTAAQELRAKKLLTGHGGKFALSDHAWDEPVKRVYAAAQEKKMHLLTPMIGEKVNIDNNEQVFTTWWQHLQ
jgi:L-ascorbate metabolism protein UlaG (beta-lactamase superfamily)